MFLFELGGEIAQFLANTLVRQRRRHLLIPYIYVRAEGPRLRLGCGPEVHTFFQSAFNIM